MSYQHTRWHGRSMIAAAAALGPLVSATVIGVE
jgi:hypothetical protein